MKDLKVTIMQTQLHWENKQKNMEMFEGHLDRITDNPDLIVLPEMFNTGFSMDAEKLYENMSGRTIDWLTEMAKNKKCAITGSLIVRDEDRYYNRLIWMLPDGTFDFYDKRHLFRMAGEHEHFSAGQKRLVVELKGWKILPLVCYDLRFPVWSRNHTLREVPQRELGTSPLNYFPEYDCAIYIANWPEPRNSAWSTLLKARAIENQVYVVGVNRIGKDGNDISYSGDSAVIDPKGTIISVTQPRKESFETVTLSAGELNAFREKFPVGMDADEFEVL